MQILYLQKLNATPKKNKLYPLGFELQDLSHRLISLCPSKTDKFIFISPGYLSTTVKTNQSFIKLLGTNFLGLKTFYLLNTMNGNHRLTKNPHSNSLYTILKNYLTYKNCSVPQLSLKKNFRDHRKMWFLGFTDPFSPKLTNKKSIPNFMQNVHVFAAAIGSSNFNMSTYVPMSIT